MSKLALWEANFIVDDSRPPLPGDYVGHLEALVASDRRGDAVEYFLTTAAGLPAEFVGPMRTMPVWPFFEAVAHTLAYDGRISAPSMSGRPIDPKRWRPVDVPTLVMDGGTLPWFSRGADELAKVLPAAERRTLPGQTHDVSAEAIAPVLIEFFGAGE
jgi:pimeloyl-ACP methyl ester carboxylesterase